MPSYKLTQKLKRYLYCNVHMPVFTIYFLPSYVCMYAA